MTLKETLLTVAATYAAHRELSDSRVSRLAFGDGNVLKRLNAGSDLTTERYESTMQWFSDNWPEGAGWPDNVPRPAVTEVTDLSPAPAEAAE